MTGPFENGIATKAYEYTQKASLKNNIGSTKNVSLKEARANATTAVDEAIRNGMLNLDQTFASPDNVAKYLRPILDPISARTGIELGGFIFPTSGGYYVDQILTGNSGKIPNMQIAPKKAVAGFHTHPNGTMYFSVPDAEWVNGSISPKNQGNNIPLYLLGRYGIRICQVASDSCNANRAKTLIEDSKNPWIQGIPVQ